MNISLTSIHPKIISGTFYSNLTQILKKKDKHLEIKLYDKIELDDKIAWGLGGGFLCIYSGFLCFSRLLFTFIYS